MNKIFSPNEPFDRVFLLKGIDERLTKTGKPYLTLILGTPDGSWDGRIWDMKMSSLPGLLEGDPVRAKGTAQLYQENIQLIVDEISRVDGPVDPRSIYPAAAVSEDQLRAEFRSFVDQIGEPALKTLMETMLEDRTISDAFFTSPAAITMHHARIGGLAEHSLNVCRLAHASLSAAPWLDRDLLIVGALLHDVGKILEYEIAGDFRYTLEGKLLGHIIQGHSLVENWMNQVRDLPRRLALDVLHILLSHHGQLEYGSPRTPVTAEALVIHFADDLDAKLDMVRSAGEEPETEEAFVRGLRRSFLYRNEHQDTETRRHGDAEKIKDREGPEEGKRGPSFAKATDGKKGEKGKEKGSSSSAKATEDKGRRAKGEEEPEKEKRRRGEKGKKTEKSEQEELF